MNSYEEFKTYCDTFKKWYNDHFEIVTIIGQYDEIFDKLNEIAVEGEKYPSPDPETIEPAMRLFLCQPLDSILTDKAEDLLKQAVVENMTEHQAAGLASMYNGDWYNSKIVYENTYTWNIKEILDLYEKKHPGEIEAVVVDPVDGPKFRWAALTHEKLESSKSLTVKDIRAYTGLSQVAFAERFGIPRRTIENWESGVSNPPQYVITMLARLNYII